MKGGGSITLRHGLAAVLMLAMIVAGLGRGVAATPEAGAVSVRIANVVVPICHAGRDDSSAPAGPVSPSGRGCCDVCALCAPVILPGMADFSRSRSIVRAERPNMLAPPTPHFARARTPRQAQGPPLIA